jgi:drug/metabolite transporter (DMT)-like permease
MSNTRKGSALVLISAALFGVMPILAKLAYQEQVNIHTLLALRFSIAAGAMWLLWVQQRARGATPLLAVAPATPAAPATHPLPAEPDPTTTRASTPTAGTIMALVALGALGYVGQSFSYFQAVSILSASATGLLLYTYPIIVTLLAWVLYREPLSITKVTALLTASTGALMVLGIISSLLGGGQTSFGTLDPRGVPWAAGASLIYSAYILASTRFTAGVHPIFSSAVVISSAALVYIVWGIASGQLNLAISPAGLLWATLIAVLSTVIAIVTFFAGLRYIGPSKAAIISTLEPAVTVALAALILREAITLEQAVGGMLILLSVLVLQRGRLPAAQAEPTPSGGS